MNNEVLSNISKIIERDSKSSTYKFALLRGVIDIILENSPFITFSQGRVYIPTGLLVEKWLLYYYPIFDSQPLIPQIHDRTNLSFELQFKTFVTKYQYLGGFSTFYNDLKHKGIPNDLKSDFISLVSRIRSTIVNMPMRYIGRSLTNDYYSIFKYDRCKTLKNSGIVDFQYITENLGNFSIPIDYYNAFLVMGSFMNGKDSILFKWAEFSVNASRKDLSIEKVISQILKNPITEREVNETKRIYKSILETEGQVRCVWTGKAVSAYEIDHVIPFSIWKNNDLWNLLPAQRLVNRKKRDKIPSVDLIEKQKDMIFYYWDLMSSSQSERFRKEIQMSLLGQKSSNPWQYNALNQLKDCCNYLISIRGYEEWRI